MWDIRESFLDSLVSSLACFDHMYVAYVVVCVGLLSCRFWDRLVLALVGSFSTNQNQLIETHHVRRETIIRMKRMYKNTEKLKQKRS